MTTDLICTCPSCGGLIHWATGLLDTSDFKDVSEGWVRRGYGPRAMEHVEASAIPRGHDKACPRQDPGIYTPNQTEDVSDG